MFPMNSYSEILASPYPTSIGLGPQGSGLTWEDINFFNNAFDDVSLSIAPFAPEGKAAAAKPDNTSDGNLQKYWTCEGERRILHKAGAHLDQEPYNELVATALHRRILNACDYVPYSLEGTGTSALSTCDVFLTDEEEYVPDVLCKPSMQMQTSD